MLDWVVENYTWTVKAWVKLAISLIKKIKSFKRSGRVTRSFHEKISDCDFSQNSQMSCLGVEDGKSSDKPNPFTHNFNDLHESRPKTLNRLTFAHININSLRNKFEMLQEVIGNSIDVLLKSRTKINASFPSSQFILDGFTPPHRLDRTQHGGVKMLFIRQDVPSKLLNVDISGIENLIVEINLRSKMCFISGSYNPHLNSIRNHLVQLRKRFALYSSK